MQNEPRPHSRFPYCANAVLICLPHICEVTLIDMSDHAVLVEPKGNVGIRLGDQTRLRVLTERGNQAFEADALVAHLSEQGIGLEIEAIDRHAKSTLRRLIEMNLGTPDLASRSLPVLLRENCSGAPAASTARVHSGCGASTLWPIHA